MDVLREVFEWFTDPANYSGDFGIPARLLEHVQMSLYATVMAASVALPLGLLIGHTKRAEFVTISIGNIGRALPSFGVLAIFFPLTFGLPGEIGFWATLVALFVLAIPPVLTNTIVGVKGVDASTVEAARGMGMTGRQVLTGLELPLAAPLVAAGIRTAAVQVVATATLGAVVAWGGLGRFIIDGFAARDAGQTAGGAILVALLAIATELSLNLVEKTVRPKGLARDEVKPAFGQASQVGRPAEGPI